MTETVTKIAPQVTNDGDHDRYQHYFRKSDIDKNLLEGTPMRALCGKIVAQQVDPQGRTVCPTCKDLYENHVGSNLPPDQRG